MRVGHVLLTVFGRRAGIPGACQKGPRLDEGRLRYQWRLFTTYTVPSIAAQSERDFSWLIICHPESPAWFRALTSTVDSAMAASFSFAPRDRALDGTATDAADVLLVTSLGSADALHRRAIERVREDYAADPYTSAAITLTDGYLLQDSARRLRPYHLSPSPFHTSITLRGAARRDGHARSVSDGEPMFVLVSQRRQVNVEVADEAERNWLDPGDGAAVLERDFAVLLDGDGGRGAATGPRPARRPRARPQSRPGWLSGRAGPARSQQRVVVSIPCSQAWESLAGAVESILDQTHRDLLVIVANDGDSQPGWEVLGHVDDPRLVRIDFPATQGRYFLDQTVLMARLGQYLLPHDADEWSEPDRLQCLLEEMRRDHSIAAVSSHYLHGEDAPGTPGVVGPGLAPPPVSPFYPEHPDTTAYWALYDAASLLSVGGCYSGFRVGHDTFLAHLMGMNGAIARLDRPLYHRVASRAPADEPARFDQALRQSATEEFSRLYAEAYHLYCEYLQGSVDAAVLRRQLRGLAWRHVSESEWQELRAESGRLRWQALSEVAGGSQGAPDGQAVARARPSPPARPARSAAGDRLLAAYTAPVRTVRSLTAEPASQQPGAMVVTGILTARGQATLAPDAVVQSLLPHDAAAMLERVGADLVLIEAAALLPGNAWAYAAHPAAADRGRRLADLVDAAHALGRPVAFLRNVPDYRIPGLSWLDAMCDAALEGDLGVQLTRFNPLDLPAARPCDPLFAAAREPWEPLSLRLLLDRLTAGGQPAVRVADLPWRELPECYRRHGLFLAVSAAQAREQRACGARVVGPPETGEAAGGMPARDVASVIARLAAAREAGVPAMAEVRQALREIFQTAATPVRLAEIARLAGLRAGVPAGRQIAVLAEAHSAAEAETVVRRLLRQKLRPAEVVVVGNEEQEITPALAALADVGTTVHIAGAVSDQQAAQRSRCAWIVRWDRAASHSDWYLLDLVCARECSGADVVGGAPGADYVFDAAAEPALVRRDLLAPGAPPPSSWRRRGVRTLSIAY